MKCTMCDLWGKHMKYDRKTNTITYEEPCKSCHMTEERKSFVAMPLSGLYKIQHMTEDELTDELVRLCKLFGNCKNKRQLIAKYLSTKS